MTYDLFPNKKYGKKAEVALAAKHETALPFEDSIEKKKMPM